MSKIDKLLAKMRHHPFGWRIEEIKSIAERYNITYRQPGTSHVTFRSMAGQKVTIPAHKPIKPIYIKLFLTMIDNLGGDNE